MAVEQTLSIIKPDAVKKNLIGKIVSRFENGGLSIVAMKLILMSKDQAETFYAMHKGKPFFEKLVQFMTSGPCVVQVLSGENAILANRTIMGPTDPSQWVPGSIRADFAENVTINCVHGSDSVESAAKEIAFFFPHGFTRHA